LGHEDDHHPREGGAGERTDERGQEIVRGALERERLHEVAAPRPDRARNPELAAALGREHDEDEEDEEDARRDRERAERREERHEGAAGLVRCLDGVALRGVDVEAERPEHRIEAVDDLFRQRRA
jgi:hypothetical protein